MFQFYPENSAQVITLHHVDSSCINIRSKLQVVGINLQKKFYCHFECLYYVYLCNKKRGELFFLVCELNLSSLKNVSRTNDYFAVGADHTASHESRVDWRFSGGLSKQYQG